MIALYILLFVVVLFGIKFGKNKDYLSKDSTTSIKGIFVIIVFFNHYASYVNLGSKWYDRLFGSINGWIGQLMVVMFLFYSGYGIFLQIRRTDGKYIDSFLKHRFLPTWLQFAVCITFFLIMDIVTGTISNYSVLHIILSYTGWTSIGNSNWFMFVTFALYIIIFISFIIFRNNRLNGLIGVSVLAIVLTVILYFVKESWWWNTLLCFPLGMWFCYLKEWIDRHIFCNRYIITLISATLVFGVLWFVDYSVCALGAGYILLAVSFALLIVTVTMRVNVGNKILRFFGNHVFSIYILQRIPLIIFKKHLSNNYLYFVVSFIATLIISWLFDCISGKVRECIISKRTLDNRS